MTETVVDRLATVLTGALHYDSNVVEAPVALLWPDKGRQWEHAIDALRGRLRIVSLGDYDLSKRAGPAYWVRCVITETVVLDAAPDGVPLVYMPGVSRDDLRTVASTNQVLAPLAAVQHRSQWFTHLNGRDWTVRALFDNKDRGFALNVAGDEATGAALVDSLLPILSQPMSRLEGRHLDATFLNTLLNPDPTRLLLQWLDDPKRTRQALSDPHWRAFADHCRRDYNFDPEVLDVIEGAQRLGLGDGPWAQIWQRFRESPTDYPGIPTRLGEAQPVLLLPQNPGAWPKAATAAEDGLRNALHQLDALSPTQARASLLALDDQHKERRGYVWADLGRTPLALALEHLAKVGRRSAASCSASTVPAIAEWYAEEGWHVDGAVLAALQEVEQKEDLDAVTAALSTTYRPWLDSAARALQAAVGPEANAETYRATPNPPATEGELIMFIDGLRLDVAHLLADRLKGNGAEVLFGTGLAALPTVTQTAKPVLVPIDQGLLEPGEGLDARRAPDGPTAGVQVLRSLLGLSGVQVLSSGETGDPGGRAWTEAGEIDHRGHDLGVRLAHEIDDQVQRIARRIRQLLEAGWTKVIVVTDHGWLLLPGGLPKNDSLPVAATVAKKGRCARVKDGSVVNVPTVPWHWDNHVSIAVAPGISCFEANKAYEHGGVSPQECVVPRLSITSTGATLSAGAEITKVKWRGLTFVVEFSDLPDGATVDLRRHAGDAGSSIAVLARVTGGTGKIMLLVENEDLQGERARLVVLGADGTLLLQRDTVVGQNP
jgi:hypothetical protein